MRGIFWAVKVIWKENLKEKNNVKGYGGSVHPRVYSQVTFEFVPPAAKGSLSSRSTDSRSLKYMSDK